MMSRAPLPVLLLLLAGRLSAQWDVPVKVVLDGDSLVHRQVGGLAAPIAPDQGVSTQAERERSFLSGNATGSDTLSVQFSPPLQAYFPGLRVSIVPDTGNTGPVLLRIDALPPVPVHRGVNMDLDSGEVRAHVPMLLIHDGAAFQVVGPLDVPCDPGYFPISRDACIQRSPNAPVTFWQALIQCHDQGARLCSFNEWFSACTQADGLFPSIMGWEWVDHAANNADLTKQMGLNNQTLIPDCFSGSRAQPSITSYFRCCKDR